MKTKYQLDNPNNCRVKVDFNNPKKPAHFEYVGNDSAFVICRRMFASKIYIHFGLILVMLMGFYLALYVFTQNYLFWILGVFMLFLLFGSSYILAFIFSKTRLIRLTPYIWASGKTKFYVQFQPEDIKNNIVEIPLFGNQFLNYKLTGDFLDKINTIDIIEHPFNIMVLKMRGLKYYKEFKPNEFLWKAVFTFKEPPKIGFSYLCILLKPTFLKVDYLYGYNYNYYIKTDFLRNHADFYLLICKGREDD